MSVEATGRQLLGQKLSLGEPLAIALENLKRCPNKSPGDHTAQAQELIIHKAL